MRYLLSIPVIVCGLSAILFGCGEDSATNGLPDDMTLRRGAKDAGALIHDGLASGTDGDASGNDASSNDASSSGSDGLSRRCVPNATLGCIDARSYRVCAEDGLLELTAACPPESPDCSGSGDCAPCSVDRCTSAGVLSKCTASGYRPVACPATQTCLATAERAACGGSCRSGSYRCQSEPAKLERCTVEGEWTLESCELRSQCAAAASSCSSSDPYDFGNFDIAQRASRRPFSPDLKRAYLLPFVPPAKAFVTALRLNGSATGGACRLSLYDDANGLPHAKLFSIAPNVAVRSDASGEEPPATVHLVSGRAYWIAASCGVTTSGTPVLWQAADVDAQYYELDVESFSEFMPLLLQPEKLRPVTGKTMSFFVELQNDP